jgi:hypothetical protein
VSPLFLIYGRVFDLLKIFNIKKKKKIHFLIVSNEKIYSFVYIPSHPGGPHIIIRRRIKRWKNTKISRFHSTVPDFLVPTKGFFFRSLCPTLNRILCVCVSYPQKPLNYSESYYTSRKIEPFKTHPKK